MLKETGHSDIYSLVYNTKTQEILNCCGEEGITGEKENWVQGCKTPRVSQMAVSNTNPLLTAKLPKGNVCTPTGSSVMDVNTQKR